MKPSFLTLTPHPLHDKADYFPLSPYLWPHCTTTLLVHTQTFSRGQDGDDKGLADDGWTVWQARSWKMDSCEQCGLWCRASRRLLSPGGVNYYPVGFLLAVKCLMYTSNSGVTCTFWHLVQNSDRHGKQSAHILKEPIQTRHMRSWRSVHRCVWWHCCVFHQWKVGLVIHIPRHKHLFHINSQIRDDFQFTRFKFTPLEIT